MPAEGWKNLAKAEPVALIPPLFHAMVKDDYGVVLWQWYKIYEFLRRKFSKRW
jgi:hypothetical protein